MILPAVTKDMLIARNREWTDRRRRENLQWECAEQMAYLPIECFCGHHTDDAEAIALLENMEAGGF